MTVNNRIEYILAITAKAETTVGEEERSVFVCSRLPE